MLRDYLVPLTLSVGAATALSLPRVAYEDLTPPQVQWSSDVVGSFLRARDEDKLVIVYFGAEWDTAAKEFEHETWPDPEVRSILRSEYVAIKIDATDDESPETRGWQSQFKVVGDPTIIVLSRGGYGEIMRFNEYVKPDVMATKLLAASDEPHSRGHFFRW